MLRQPEPGHISQAAPLASASASAGAHNRIVALVLRKPCHIFEISIRSIIRPMNQYTAVIQRDGTHWIGWLEEIPGVNSQGESLAELIANLRSALIDALEMNRSDLGRQEP